MAHHGILSPVAQAVVHGDLLAFGNVSDGYDDEPDLTPTMHLSNPAVGRWVEQHRAADAASALFRQLRHTTGHTHTHTLRVNTAQDCGSSSPPMIKKSGFLFHDYVFFSQEVLYILQL